MCFWYSISYSSLQLAVKLLQVLADFHIVEASQPEKIVLVLLIIEAVKLFVVYLFVQPLIMTALWPCNIFSDSLKGILCEQSFTKTGNFFRCFLKSVTNNLSRCYSSVQFKFILQFMTSQQCTNIQR